ncbi:MAG: glycosyltransferase family 4 protein [bacterium]|nr:glycosyltransferase family 4 protein [bacterium]
MERMEPWRGGAETSAQQFIQHLLALGHEVELYTRSRPSPAPGLEVKVVRCAATTRSGRSAAFARAVDKRLAKSDADVIHAISPCLRADVYEPRGGTVVETIARNLALRRSQATRSLKRLTNRFNLRQRLMLDLERRLLTREPRPMVVALSDYVIEQLCRHYAFPETHIRKIFNGVDPDPADDEQRRQDRQEIRALYGIDDDALLVMLVAHNFKLKGVGRWIEALRLLQEAGGPKVQSLVIGRDNPVHWQRVAASAGVADRVHFVGPTRRIAAFYRAADALVHPTYYDPCSRVVLEAMAAGLACVTTRYDGAAEMIDDGVSGYVLESPEDLPDLVRAVEMLADDDHRAAIGRAAANGSEGASMRRHTEQIAELYAELSARRTTA